MRHVLLRLALPVLLILAPRAESAEATATTNSAASALKKFQLTPGLQAELFASEPLLQNPVCFSIDARGRFYVVETHRYRGAIFDITANTPWLLDDLSFRTVNDRAAFLARTFATNFSVLTNTSELIRLVEDRDGDGRAETSSVFADGFNKPESGTAAGVLAQGTNVWFTSIPDLWRMTNGTVATNLSKIHPPARHSSLGNRHLLATGLGVHISVSGHDVHGLIRGHDGRIYFSFGDRGVCVTNREGVVLNVPDTGGVLRCEPDGSHLEIFCTGLRNPQELVFDDLGNLWTVDNDTAGADPCRVLHLVEGGDYGWRMSYQHMRGFGPWVSEELWRGGLDGILPPAGTVSQGPAGLAFYPGTGLTPQLEGKFVHADFPGGVWAFSVKPRGASYEIAEKEKLLWNCWPTDVDFGPDGALYVLDWVQGWAPPGQGRIYRLTANAERGTRNAEQVAEVKRLLAEGMTKRGEKELLGLLGHQDRRVRLEAQWELAKVEHFAQLARLAANPANQLARLHAIWAMSQIVRAHPRTELVSELEALLPLLKDRDPEVRAQSAYLMGAGRLLYAQEQLKELLADPAPRVQFRAMLAYRELFSGCRIVAGVSSGNRFRLSLYESLKRKIVLRTRWRLSLSGPGLSWVTPQLIKQIASRERMEPCLEQASVMLLSEIGNVFGSGSVFAAHTKDFTASNSAAVRLALMLAYRRMEDSAIARFLSDTDPQLVLEAARTINDAPIPAAYPALAGLLDNARFRDANWGWAALSNLTPAGPFSAKVRPPCEQVLRRALNANFRLGASTNAEALVRFARAGSETGAPGPAALRAEALFLLGAWEVLPAPVGNLPIKPTKDPNHGSVPTVNPENWPGWFDRVVGLWRPLPPRPANEAQRALRPHIAALVADAAPEVAQAALEAAVKLRLTNASPALLARQRDAATPASLRQQIPDALAALHAPELGEAVTAALADADPAVRAAALPHLGGLPGEGATTLLGELVTNGIAVPSSTGEVRLAQAALVALGRIESAAANAILRSTLASLVEGTLPPALALEALESTARRSNPEITTLLAQRAATLPKDDALAPWRPALTGGEAGRGRSIFFEKVEVQCSRCHAIKGEGGIVGPALDRIARERSREYLLEAMVLPNRAIAPGFENVNLTLKTGAEHAGVVKSESETELRLESPEEGPLRLAKANIATRQRGLSAMPEGLEQLLTQRELRDLVEFLASLR